MKNYYRKQLRPVLQTGESDIKIQFTNHKQQTKWLSINLESIEVIKEALDLVQKELLEKRK